MISLQPHQRHPHVLVLGQAVRHLPHVQPAQHQPAHAVALQHRLKRAHRPRPHVHAAAQVTQVRQPVQLWRHVHGVPLVWPLKKRPRQPVLVAVTVAVHAQRSEANE